MFLIQPLRKAKAVVIRVRGKAQKRCSQCGALGHNYKKCHQNALHDDANVGPSGNPRDGACSGEGGI